LNKLANVVNDAAAPADSVLNSAVVVVKDNNIGVLLRGGATVHTHSKTNLSLRKGEAVVEGFAHVSADSVQLLHAGDKHVLVFGVSTVDNLDLFLNFVLKDATAFVVFEGPGVAFSLVIFFDKRSDEGTEFCSAHTFGFGLVIVVDQFHCNADSKYAGFVVTRQNTCVKAGIEKFVTHIFNLRTERVVKEESCG